MIRHRARSRLTFVYSGYGSQWPGMGRTLLSEPGVWPTLHRCEATVRELTGWSLLEHLSTDEAPPEVGEAVAAQTAIFTIQACLTDLWRRRGVIPDEVVGYSLGEVAAAHAVGALSIEQALTIVVRRAEAVQRFDGTGTMAVAGLDPHTVDRLVARGGDVHVAAVNAPAVVVVAGSDDAVDALGADVRAAGGWWLPLRVRHALHSPRAAVMRRPIVEALADVPPPRGNGHIVSSAVGGRVPVAALDASFWADTVIRPVRFRDAIRTASGRGHDVLLELGPQATLSMVAEQSLAGHAARVTSLVSMRRGTSLNASLLDVSHRLRELGYGLRPGALNIPAASVASVASAASVVGAAHGDAPRLPSPEPELVAPVCTTPGAVAS
ncbi:acyltransferase domain-containing protein [Promicromonospora sp. Populi]|uniref:acyltransferase domain-containing protein n=1 Tax=Promicromonospora sp. Populi TaxID=3239420 RepID=UPI0034E251F3